MTKTKTNPHSSNQAVRTPTVDAGHHLRLSLDSTGGPISARKRILDWLPIVLALLPALPLTVLYVKPPTWPAAADFERANWGNIASCWGLAVSIGVLVFAKGAKKAAEEARSAEKLNTALASLEAALVKCLEIGQLGGAQKWPAVEIRAQEVLQVCHTTLAAWGDNHALTDSRRRLSEVATLMRSIVEETRNDAVNTKTVLMAQLDAHVKLSVVVGKIQKAHTSGSV